MSVRSSRTATGSLGLIIVKCSRSLIRWKFFSSRLVCALSLTLKACYDIHGAFFATETLIYAGDISRVKNWIYALFEKLLFLERWSSTAGINHKKHEVIKRQRRENSTNLAFFFSRFAHKLNINNQNIYQNFDHISAVYLFKNIALVLFSTLFS